MGFERVIFEYPTGWIDVNSDPLALQHQRCLENIKNASCDLGLDFETRICPRMADFAPRFAPRNVLYISVHTVGVAENVVRLKESYLPGYYYFDRTGYSGWAELAYNVELQQKAVNYISEDQSIFLKELRAEKILLNISKYPQSIQTYNYVQSRQPYIFLALQTSDDLVSRLALTNQLMLAEVMAEKINGTGLNLLIKKHPFCRDSNVDRVLNKLKREYDCVKITQESVNSLIVDAKCVVTVNSGVGFEALIMGKPVVTAGRSDYSFVTKKISDNFDIQLFDSIKDKFDFISSEKFICFFLKEYCLNINDINKTKKLIYKWMDDTYSSMTDLSNFYSLILDETQKYMADLEKMRNMAILESKKRKFEIFNIEGVAASLELSQDVIDKLLFIRNRFMEKVK